VYPVAGWFEPPKRGRFTTRGAKSIYRGRVTDPRVTLFGYGDNTNFLLQSSAALGWTTALQIPYNVVYTTLYIQRTTTDHVVSAIDVEAPDPRNAIVRYIKR